ncbi:MAG: glutathione S-transferase family protein [Pseudomonadota bacterium]
MADYKLFGAETSPYSIKVRSALRYKGASFDWIPRSRATEADFRALATSPTIPLLVAPGRPASQDSTAMLAALEADKPDPVTVPEDPACAALALVLEDYGDEWLNKAMFHERWSGTPDREAAALRLLTQMLGEPLPEEAPKLQAEIAESMASRLDQIGAGPKNAKVIKGAFQRFAELLNDHLKDRLFIFGGRPTAADFSIAAQLRQMLDDPSPSEWLRDRAPFVVAWCDFMDAPKANGPFEPLDDLKPTLLPIFAKEIAKTYLTWSPANAAAHAAGETAVKVKIDRRNYEQPVQVYAARAFTAVKGAMQTVLSESDPLTAFCKKAKILPLFTP